MCALRRASFVGEGSERRPLVLWPVYFEAGKSRSEGRRVPVHLAVKGVTAEAVLKAAKAAGYEAEFDPNAKHPAHWFDSSGRVLVRTSQRNQEFSNIHALLTSSSPRPRAVEKWKSGDLTLGAIS